MASSALYLNILFAGKSLILEILTTSEVLHQYMDVEKIHFFIKNTHPKKVYHI